MKEVYCTREDLIKSVDEERNRIRTLIEYLLNKNSKIDGVDYVKFFDDIQDLEKELL